MARTEHNLGKFARRFFLPSGKIAWSDSKPIHAAFYPFGWNTLAVVRFGGRRYGVELPTVDYKRLRSKAYKLKLAHSILNNIEHDMATPLGAKIHA